MPRWREPSEWVSNQSNTLSFTSAGMPGPRSVTENTTASWSRCGGEGNGLAGGREAHRIGEQIEQRLAHAPLVGDEAADVGRGADLEPDAVLDQAVLHPFGGRFHGPADVDGAEIERHGAGVDGGEVEDVVDDREQRVGRDRDVAEIFALLLA